MEHARGWMLIFDLGADHDTYGEGTIKNPGSGTCRRSDGRAGPLPELVPDGWELLDLPLTVYDLDSTERDRIYLIFDPRQVTHRQFGGVEWVVRDGELIFKIDAEDPSDT